MPAPTGFTVDRRQSGEVVIRHHGRPASTLRGTAAARLLARLDAADDDQAQHVLARATGNYRRGNERR